MKQNNDESTDGKYLEGNCQICGNPTDRLLQMDWEGDLMLVCNDCEGQ